MRIVTRGTPQTPQTRHCRWPPKPSPHRLSVRDPADRLRGRPWPVLVVARSGRSNELAFVRRCKPAGAVPVPTISSTRGASERAQVRNWRNHWRTAALVTSRRQDFQLLLAWESRLPKPRAQVRFLPGAYTAWLRRFHPLSRLLSARRIGRVRQRPPQAAREGGDWRATGAWPSRRRGPRLARCRPA